MSQEDITSRAGKVFNDLVEKGRQVSRRVSTDGAQKNSKAIIWSIFGLPDNLRVADLTMKINPTNLKENYQQLINRKRTAGGFIEEYWGEQLDSLSASGITAAFVNGNGLTNKDRRDTSGFDNFQTLVDYYRNNGSIYDTRTGALVAQGSIVMNYDSVIRHGYFESFSIKEDPLKPYNLMYEFTFKVSYEQAPGRKTSFRDVTPVSVAKTSISPTAQSSSSNGNTVLDILGNQE